MSKPLTLLVSLALLGSAAAPAAAHSAPKPHRHQVCRRHAHHRRCVRRVRARAAVLRQTSARRPGAPTTSAPSSSSTTSTTSTTSSLPVSVGAVSGVATTSIGTVVSSTSSSSAPTGSSTAPRATTATGAASTVCALYASPSGSDSSGDGSSARPFATIGRLDKALAPGQTGCLEGGVYGDESSWYDLTASGTAAGRITLTAAPGESVTVKGWIELEGAYTTMSHLNIDESNNTYTETRTSDPSCSHTAANGLAISGPNNIFEYNNLYQSDPALRGEGIGIGWWGNADNTVVRYNLLHDLGECRDLDHVIYLDSGNGVQIYGNWMWNDPHGWGVQLYPKATNARVFANVIDHVGSGFTVGAESGGATSGNQIFHNVVMNSSGLPAAGLSGVGVSDYWGGTPGTGNSFENNDCFNDPQGVAHVTNVSLSGNITQNPQFNDAAQHDYSLAAGSPVASWGLWDGRGL